jgi:hypothetical protein
VSGAKIPRPPAGLGTSGTALWRSLWKTFGFDERETAILSAACRQADDVARLEVLLERDGPIVAGSKGQPRLTPIVAEIRQGRLALVRMLGELGLPADVKGRPVTSRSTHASVAANARWGRVAKLREVDDGVA